MAEVEREKKKTSVFSRSRLTLRIRSGSRQRDREGNQTEEERRKKNSVLDVLSGSPETANEEKDSYSREPRTAQAQPARERQRGREWTGKRHEGERE